ncbi:MAG TPA: SpoIIE family protein phosphatase, partial [Gemmataceae bacterium]|nr:SpoIIE family protein phosphatase [Gemmataceae bacterium]
MTPFRANLKEVWSRLTWPDVVSTVVAAGGLLAAIFAINGRFFSFLKYLAVLAGIYLLFRLIGWWRDRLLWSLRNRLIVAYLFIAVVPILSIVTLAVLAGRILYSQLGAYLLHEDLQQRIAMIADISEHIAAAHATLPKGVSEDESERVLAAQSSSVHDRELPKLKIAFSNDATLLRKVSGPAALSFAGIVQESEHLFLMSIRAMPEHGRIRLVTLRVPVTEEFLSGIAPDLGAIQLSLTEKYVPGAREGIIYPTANGQYITAGRIVAQNRALQPAMIWIDVPVEVVSRLDSIYVGPDGKVEPLRPVLAVFNARPTQLNARMFTSFGELRDTYRLMAIGLAGLLVLIAMVALIPGFVLTRRITNAVADLYQATQFVKAGDFSHRIKMKQRDQLGELGESFNQMTGSIGTLIEEQNKRQRLENEISIAREVQNQLFPSTLPSVPGVEIEAICKAARSVSGDYYDFIQLSPTHIAIAIADISGKGISAALLMASLQAALRSQLLVEGSECLGMVELVSRLNKHLVRNTGDDRFATFFIAVYDSATRTLRYTNAGHLPAFLICKDGAQQLDKGGMVLGVMEDYVYEEGSLIVAPDSLLIGYSDGLIEPE